jgi:mono/diheme cytochrome c family protein
VTDAGGGSGDRPGGPDGSGDRDPPERGREDREAGRDYGPDVEEIHRPIAREPRDPVEGREPVPWWVWGAVVVAIFWGGFYLGRFGGTFGAETHVALQGREPVTAQRAAAARTAAASSPVEAGRRVYENACQTCHQANGRGVSGIFPPVVGSRWVTGDPATLVRIVLGGLRGPIEVAGETYNGAMPAWANQLSDDEIAAVLTYIRQWEANSAGPVEPSLVADLRPESEERAGPWTVEALEEASSGTGGGASDGAGPADGEGDPAGRTAGGGERDPVGGGTEGGGG